MLDEVSARAPGAKAIMVTAFATPESIRRAFAAGAYDYLEKTGQRSGSFGRLEGPAPARRDAGQRRPLKIT
jgi:hypothetical protein